MKLTPGDHDAQFSDVRLHYHVAGKGPLVVVTSPGWGVGSTYLVNGLAPLEKTFTLLFLDTRGSGLSTQPDDRSRMSSEIMADDIDRLRDYLSLKSISLLGHSNGGTIALDYAERYPNRVDKVVLLDAEVLGDREHEATGRFLKLWDYDRRYHAAITHLRKDEPVTTTEEFEKDLDAILPLYFSDPERFLPAFQRTLVGMHLSLYAQQTQDANDGKSSRKQSLDYGKITAKVLILNGTVDWICPAEVAVRMHDGISGSKLSLYANAGHVLWIEQPERLFLEVTEFLKE
jgi:pimeloyl-ACP methyl ester carboxylesterase